MLSGTQKELSYSDGSNDYPQQKFGSLFSPFRPFDSQNVDQCSNVLSKNL